MPQRQLNIYQKLAKIRKQVEVMKHDAKGYNFRYTKEESILAKITVFMDKYSLSLMPEIVPGSIRVNTEQHKKTKTTQKGDLYEDITYETTVVADMAWTWIDNENPEERVKVPWAMVGQQTDASQSFGSGLTYASRYFLLKFFNISTSDDDPDEFRRKQLEAEAAEDKIVAEEIIKNADAYLQEFVTKNPESRNDVLALVKKYEKSGDYNKIQASSVAGKFLQEVLENFKIDN
jgi:hypothetical protein